MNFISRSVARVLSSRAANRKWLISSRKIGSDGRSPTSNSESGGRTETPEEIEYRLSNSASDVRPASPELLEYIEDIQKSIMAKNPKSVQDISPAAIEESITEKKPAKSEKVETSNPWNHLLANPKEWLDYRGNKANGLVKPLHPDFKRKGDGLALWLNRAPDWVLPKLEGLEFDVIAPLKKSRLLNEHLWKDLAENPHKWEDNRTKKTNPRAPDFINKETREALWMPDSPTWVLSKLPPKTKKEEP